MRYVLLNLVVLFSCFSVSGQITITAGDMPVAGDTLRYSSILPTGMDVNTGITGASIAWNYSFTPIAQGVDTYKTAIEVNPLYVLTAGASAYGIKIADSLPGAGAFIPVSIQQLYTFFEKKTGPDRFEAKAIGASISGFPTATSYTPPDVWYFFPLTYGNYDSTGYALNLSLATFGGLKEAGYRVTRVDGWGTIQTPYYTTPVNCIRVRSEIHEIDSISFTGMTFGVPRNTVEYKWLVNGDHYPALWVTSNVFLGTEAISVIRYRDSYRPELNPIVSNVKNVSTSNEDINAYPVPAINGVVTLSLPADWKTFSVQLFDAGAREVAHFINEHELDLRSFAAGHYVARIISGDKVAYVHLVR